MRSTYTYAILELSLAAYAEIRQKLKEAGYSDQFHKDSNHGEVIDMHGIAVAVQEKPVVSPDCGHEFDARVAPAGPLPTTTETARSRF